MGKPINKVGRPIGAVKHVYKKKYCTMLVDHMALGYSFEAFGGIIRCGMSVLYKWIEENEDFSEAKLVGTSLSRLWWEKKCIEGIVSYKDGPQVNAGLWRINMKNRFGWHDAQKIEHSVEKTESKLVIDLSGVSKIIEEKKTK